MFYKQLLEQTPIEVKNLNNYDPDKAGSQKLMIFS